MYPKEKLVQIIAEFGKAPDGQLDHSLAKECREFDGEDPVKFLRNLRDKCVRYGASSGFVIKAVSMFLTDQPEETEDEKAARRADIEANE